MSKLDATLRYLDTVLVLPVGRWRTTGDVHDALLAKGYTVSRRTVQRDLLKLAASFGIDLELRADAQDYLWRRTRHIEDAAA